MDLAFCKPSCQARNLCKKWQTTKFNTRIHKPPSMLKTTSNKSEVHTQGCGSNYGLNFKSPFGKPSCQARNLYQKWEMTENGSHPLSHLSQTTK